METRLTTEKHISVSPSYRWLENGHIFLWLIKDTCWATTFRAGGIFMIFPTMGMALYLLWKSRRMRTEFFHNIAVCFWIAANAAWMIGEFYERDAYTKPVTIACFVIGLLVLLFYYAAYYAQDKRKQKEYDLR